MKDKISVLRSSYAKFLNDVKAGNEIGEDPQKTVSINEIIEDIKTIMNNL